VTPSIWTPSGSCAACAKCKRICGPCSNHTDCQYCGVDSHKRTAGSLQKAHFYPMTVSSGIRPRAAEACANDARMTRD